MARIIPLPPHAAAPVATPSAREDEAALHGDRDLLISGALFWLASVARVTVALVHREIFEVEASLAFLCALLLPWICWRAHARQTADDATGSSCRAKPERRVAVIVPLVRTTPQAAPGRDRA